MDDKFSLTVQTFCAYAAVCCGLENFRGSDSAMYIFASVNWLAAVFARFLSLAKHASAVLLARLFPAT